MAGSAALLAAFAFAGALLPPGRAWVAGLAPVLLLVPLAECDVRAVKNDATTTPGTHGVVKDNVWRRGLPGEPFTK